MKSRIQVLPDSLRNKISAGEIIERPASVVKELLENAIDAGADRISVDVREGGQRSIRVTDNGEGMTLDDTRLAFERHATSKLSREEDLQNIRTMGFRGEALPSIASVSKVRLVTALKGAVQGSEVSIHGGTFMPPSKAPAVPGTMIEVDDLFYNTPARRKFLKTRNTEFSHILQAVRREAFSHPWIHFSLTHNRKTVLDLPAVKDEYERTVQILGQDGFAPEEGGGMLEVRAEQEGMRLRGWVSPPGRSRGNRDHQEFFLNRRWIRNPTLSHAVSSAYDRLIGKGRFPQVFLFIDIDPRKVDVNVHPAKREVRFRDSSDIHRFVQGVLRDRLLKEGFVPESPESPIAVTKSSFELKRPSGHETGGRGRWETGPPSESLLKEAVNVYKSHDTVPEHSGVSPSPLSPRPGVQAIGQVDRTYLVALVESELHLLDQHAAHERLIYERLLNQFQNKRVDVQPLLIPRVVEFPPEEAALLRENHAVISGFGLQIEEFGPTSFRVQGMPVLLGSADPGEVLAGLVEDLQDGDIPSGEGFVNGVLASIACQSAVKANQKMANDQIQGLMEDLYREEVPPTCPHGRPIRVRFNRADLERMFHRR